MIKGKSMWEVYPKLIEWCERYGEDFTPRGLGCKELRPMHFYLECPQLSLYNCEDRRLNYRFFAVETLGYIAGLDGKWYMDLLVDTNSNFEKFRDADGGLLWGYGPRLRQSLVEVCEHLTKDPNSRQEVCSIWSPGINDKVCSNTPCTIMLHFFAERMKPYGPEKEIGLSLQVYMRSNDLDWGTPYDVPAFCSILMAVCACVGMQPCSYYHSTGSIHLYDDHKPIARGEQLNNNLYDMTILPTPGPWVDNLNLPGGRKMKSIQSMAKALLLDLSGHRLSGCKWKDFESGVTGDYWQWWVDLIRFNWNSQ